MAAGGVDSRLFSTTLSRNPGNGASVRASHHTSNAVTSTMPYTTTLDGLRVSVSVSVPSSGSVPTATASLIRRDCSTGSRRRCAEGAGGAPGRRPSWRVARESGGGGKRVYERVGLGGRRGMKKTKKKK